MTDPASIVEGLKAIRDQAQDVLARLGFARRDDAGTTFDPARHEAVAVLAQEGAPDGTVLHVLRPAYGDGEQQLRPALVVVAAAGPRGARGGDLEPRGGAAQAVRRVPVTSESLLQ